MNKSFARQLMVSAFLLALTLSPRFGITSSKRPSPCPWSLRPISRAASAAGNWVLCGPQAREWSRSPRRSLGRRLAHAVEPRSGLPFDKPWLEHTCRVVCEQSGKVANTLRWEEKRDALLADYSALLNRLKANWAMTPSADL